MTARTERQRDATGSTADALNDGVSRRILPSDWPLVPLGEFCSFTNGVNADKRAYGHGVPFVNVLEVITTSHLGASDVPGRVMLSKAQREKFAVQRGDILFNRTSETAEEVGLSAVYDDDESVVFGGFVIRGRFTIDRLDPTYAGYALRAPAVRSQIIAKAQGAIRANISQASLRRVLVPIPSKLEQRAISQAFSDVDGLLEALEALIAKKRDIKQATMQQLLTGKTRLPGFKGEWETKRLGEIAEIRNQKVMPAEVSPRTLCVELEHVAQDDGRLLKRATARASTSAKYRFSAGDVLFGRLRSYLRKYWLADCGGICTTEIWPLMVDPDQAVSRFLLGIVQSHRFIETASVSYGTHMPRADWDVMKDFEVKLPKVSEQTAIAAVLSDMDAEIDALERRREKTHSIKQGMMQQLLTGRVRLVATEAQPTKDDTDVDVKRRHSWAFNEAVVISTLAKHFGTEGFPLGRKRYTKLAYLLHRHAEGRARGYLKKAAGPYNPSTKYGGPERIALEKGYIRKAKSGRYTGFLAADEIGEAEGYFEKWYGRDVIRWLEQFRYKKNDDLELLTTVDMAAEELRTEGKNVDVPGVKSVISRHPEWKAKLDRPIFCDSRIAEAIEQSERLLDAGGAGS